MKQITQKELIDLIKEKQENAKNEYESAIYGYRPIETSRARIITQERNKAYIDAYQDLICYLNSVEIVPEAKLKELGFTQEELNEMIKKTPITPYSEIIRDDRFREFERTDKDGYSSKELIDAKSVVFIRFYDNKEHFEVEIWSNCGFVNEKRFIEKTRAIAYYNNLLEWWKYWKEQK